MTMDKEFLKKVRLSNAVELGAMLDAERSDFHVIASEYASESAWLTCCVHTYGGASNGIAAGYDRVDGMARSIQALLVRMDAVRDRMELIRVALHAEMARS